MMTHRFELPFPIHALRASLAASPRAGALPSILVHIQELPEAYLIQAAVPGFTKEEASIDIDGSRMTISASRAKVVDEPAGQVIYSDQMLGSAKRIIDFEQEIDAQSVTATLANGLLEISAPKLSSKKRAVPIN